MAKLKYSIGKSRKFCKRGESQPKGLDVIWPITKLAKKGNSSCRNWRSSAWKHTRTPRSISKSHILRKEFRVSQKELLFNSRLKFIVAKLCSRWDGPFIITNVFPMVNGHQLKTFHEGPTLTVGEVESISLMELAISDGTP
ncbi:hypothetical protein CR513_28851, partial [Mucuna pruriens]